MLSIIAAVARNRAIGFQNKLIYWLPDDLRRFKSLTTGHTIIMGRKTFESLPHGALPHRRNVVLSGSEPSGERPLVGVADTRLEFFTSLADALRSCRPGEDVYVIGGARVYAEALPLADRLCLTEVADTPAEADAFFPDYSVGWREVMREAHPADERHAFGYAFVDYERC